MRRLFTWICVAVGAIVLMSGCGSTSTPLSHSEFVSRATGSCQGAARALGRLRDPRSPAQFERTVNRAGFIVQRLYDTLASLTPPKSDADRYKQFLGLLASDIRAAHAVERAVLNQRYARLAGLQNGRVPSARREARYAKALGIAPCAGVTILELPKPPKPRTQPATAGGAAPAGTTPGFSSRGPLGSSFRADFVAGCSNSASRSACECLYSQLTNHYGIDTGSEMLRLADQTRRALTSGRASDLPPAVKGAAVACRSKLGFGA